MTARPVKFGTIDAGADRHVGRQRPLRDAGRSLIRDLSDAMRDELSELARRRLRRSSRWRSRTSIWSGSSAAAARQLGVEFFVDDLQPHRQGPARPDRGVVPHLLGQSGAAAAVRDQPVVQDALPHLNKLDVDVMTFECCTSDGMDLEVDRPDDHRQEDRHRRRRPPEPAGRAARTGRGSHSPGAEAHPGRAADRVQRLRVRPRRHEPADRVLQDGLDRARRQHRPEGARAARGALPGRRSALCAGRRNVT